MEEGRVVSILCSITFIIGLIVGMFTIHGSYHKDIYDCTVKCLMVRSIQYNDKCYCEAN